METVNQIGNDIPDSELIAQAVIGDKAAFGSLYERYLEQIYRYIYYRVYNHQEAEDLTETVFLKAWEALPKSKKKVKNFRAWIYRIAQNLVIDYKRATPHVSLEQEKVPEKDVLELDGLVEKKQENQRLALAIMQLEAPSQQVIVLRFINQLSHAETAEILELKEGHVRVLQYRALQRLRELLTKESINDG